MTRLVKWLVAVAATLAGFVAFLWLGWVTGIRLWPHALKSVADRWVVAAAFSTAMAGAVLACGGWWASRDKRTRLGEEPKIRTLSIQHVHAEDGASAYGVQHGNQHVHHHYAADTGRDMLEVLQDKDNHPSSGP